MISVLIFAADAKLRRTLKRLSQNDSAITVVGSAEDQESLVRLANRTRVDVVLAQEMTSTKKLRDWRGRLNGIPCVLFIERSEQVGLDALGAGASAVLPPSADLTEIVATIRLVAEGMSVFPQELIAALSGRAQIAKERPSEKTDVNHPHLSKREIAVLTAMTDGLSNKEIALRLEISFHTVKFHVASILEKLDVETRTEAVFKAAQLGIVML
jgi:two-component system, NarL family, response regulator YdfI